MRLCTVEIWKNAGSSVSKLEGCISDPVQEKVGFDVIRRIYLAVRLGISQGFQFVAIEVVFATSFHSGTSLRSVNLACLIIRVNQVFEGVSVGVAVPGNFSRRTK